MHSIPAESGPAPVVTVLKQLADEFTRLAEKAHGRSLLFGGGALTIALVSLVAAVFLVATGSAHRFEQVGHTYLSFGGILVGPLLLVFGIASALVLSYVAIRQWGEAQRMTHQAASYRALVDLVTLDPSCEGRARDELFTRLLSGGTASLRA
ncbi:MAG: hypothetical protein M5U25_04120 [Planctomycetota bacterium]|nr:hypothetical protein [Planctomycetota bacterium]